MGFVGGYLTYAVNNRETKILALLIRQGAVAPLSYLGLVKFHFLVYADGQIVDVLDPQASKYLSSARSLRCNVSAEILISL